MFSSYGIDYNERPGRGQSHQYYTSSDTSFHYTQSNERTQQEFSHNFTLGLDYFLSDKTTLTASGLYNVGDGLSKVQTIYNDFDENGDVSRIVSRNEREMEDEENIEASLNFKKTFDKKGQLLTADFKWIKSVDDESTDYRESSMRARIRCKVRSTSRMKSTGFSRQIIVTPLANKVSSKRVLKRPRGLSTTTMG